MFKIRALLLSLVAILSVSDFARATEPSKKPPKPDQLPDGVSLCVQMREQIFQCKEEFADAFVEMRNAPADKRASMRQKALEEITADGSGPLPPRRKKCEPMATAMSPAFLVEAQKQLATCGSTKDCKKRVSCIRELMGGRRPAP
jgi:hypothetical protein